MNESEAKPRETKLQEANQMMKKMLETITNSSSVERATQITQLRKVLQTIREEDLADESEGYPTALSQELKTYRDNLQKLKKVIPTAQIRLKIKGANLKRSLSHKEAVSDWFRAQETFRS